MGDSEDIFFKGMTFGFYARNGYYASKQARLEVDRMAELGTQWVCLVSTVLQEGLFSPRQFRDFEVTPGDDELLDIIDYLHDKGIKVMLRPMIECWDGSQRCHIDYPDDTTIMPGKPMTYWKRWFNSYGNLTKHYTRIASRSGCEAYSLDSELNKTVRKNEQWLNVVELARKEYSGHLTTSMIDVPQFTEQIKNKNHWFYALDSIGSSMYAPASDHAKATVAEMVEFIKPVVDKNRAFADEYGKPYYFGECGCCATEGACKLPYFWANGGGYDGTEQANYMQAVIDAFSKGDWWRGLFWWKWDEQNDRPQFRDDPAGDKGFTIYGKPTMDVMKNWCKE